MNKRKYADSIGKDFVAVARVEEGGKGFQFSRVEIPVGSRLTLAGMMLDPCGKFTLQVRESQGLIRSLTPELFERYLVAV